jgi:hypothetical protein
MDESEQIIIIERLKEKLAESEIDFDEFCNLLIDNNAILSGSFLLQIIQNKFFSDKTYDIDIFTISDKNVEFENQICKLLEKVVYKRLKKELYEAVDCIDSIFSVQENFKKCENVFEITRSLFLKRQPKSPIITTEIYKGINFASHTDIIEQMMNYEPILTEINSIVNFKSRIGMLDKYQLICYKDNKYKTHEDIVNNFDLDFCANYFDGKKIFIKNYDSIKSSSCIMKIETQRIYKNTNIRMNKYINRGFDIKLQINEDIYLISRLLEDKQGNANLIIPENVTNLVILCTVYYHDITQYLNNLPSNVEKIIIYGYPCSSSVENLPFFLKEMRLYIWNMYSGITLKNGYIEPRTANIKNSNAYNAWIVTVKENIKKVPFDCKIYINDKII